MVDFPTLRVAENVERAAFYRRMAAEAVKQARLATSQESSLTFLQIAKSYKLLADSVEDIARIQSSPRA
jgi:hypothetical protein